MDVAKEDARLEGHLGHELLAEESQSCPPVEDENGFSRTNLDAARISSELYGVGTRRGDAAAHPPKRDSHVGSVLVQTTRVQPRPYKNRERRKIPASLG